MHRYYVYAYVFDDGKTYIGLTRNPENRTHQHKISPSDKRRASAVRRYADMIGVPVPDMLILESGLTDKGAQKLEDLYRQAVPKEYQLNVRPTGIGKGALGPYHRPVSLEEKESRRRKTEIAYYPKRNARRRKKLADMKAKDPEAYKEFLRKCREHAKWYRMSHRDEIRLKMRLVGRERYTRHVDYFHTHHEDWLVHQAEYRAKNRLKINARQWARRFIERLRRVSETVLIEYRQKETNHENSER